MGLARPQDERRTARDAVAFRIHGFGPDAQPLTLDVTDLSPHGMQARVAGAFRTGDRLRIRLPLLGVMAPEVRWASDGRIGCRFDPAIDLASYYELLAMVVADTSTRP